jgi:hypothetical protein
VTARTSLLFIATLLLVGVASDLHAQPPVERLKVSIWPEFDRPEALVILEAWVPAGELPTLFDFPIPAEVGSPNAVAKRGYDGRLYDAVHERVDNDGSSIIRVRADVPEVRLEYYAQLQRSGEQRSFTFRWPGGAAIGRVDFEVMKPAGADALSISGLPAVTSRVDSRGLTYSMGQLDSVGEQDGFEIELSYRKASDTLTVAAPPTRMPTAPRNTAQAPAPETKPEPASVPSWLWIVLALAAAALVVGWARKAGSQGKSS